MKIRPSLFLFLGDLTEELSTVFMYHMQPPEEVRRVITSFHLAANGKFKKTFPIIEEPAITFDFSQPDDIRLTCQHFNETGAKLNSLIVDSLIDISNVEHVNKLINAGFEIGQSQIIIITPLGDQIGSVILLPLLQLLNVIKKQHGFDLSFNILGLTPDLGNHEISRAEYLRSHAAVSEINYIIARRSKLGDSLLANFFLLSNRNVRNEALAADFKKIYPAICNFLWFSVSNQVVIRDHELIDEDGRLKLFSTFGIANIVYPAMKHYSRKISEGILALLSFTLDNINNVRISKDSLSGQVNVFLNQGKFHVAAHELETTSGTKETIFKPLKQYESLDTKIHNIAYAELFSEIEKIKDKYHNGLYQRDSVPALNHRVSELHNELLNKLSSFYLELPGHDSPAVLPALHAFYSALLRRESKYSTGEKLNVQFDFIELEQKEIDYFKQFLGIEDRQLETDLKRLNAEIINKQIHLDKLNQEIFHQFKILDRNSYISLDDFQKRDVRNDHLFDTSENLPGLDVYKPVRYEAGQLPKVVDLRTFCSQVEDQQQLSSCTANALAGAYEYLLYRFGNHREDISRLFIYYNSRMIAGEVTEDQGANLYYCIEALKRYGACLEKTWPYNPALVSTKPSAKAYEEGTRMIVGSAELIPIDLFAMKHCLAEGYPFVFGLYIPEEFTLIAQTLKPALRQNDDDQKLMNHAMLCVGYSEIDKVFIVRNSWGSHWGDKGYCYIPFDYMGDQDLCHDLVLLKSATALPELSKDQVDSDGSSIFQRLIAKGELEELHKSKEEADLQLTELQKQYLSLNGQYLGMLNRIKDPNFRVKSRTEKISNERSLIENKKREIDEKNKLISTIKERVRALAEAKDKLLRKWLLYVPLATVGVIAIISAVLLLSGLFTMQSLTAFLSNHFTIVSITCSIGFIAYALYVAVKYKELRNLMIQEQRLLITTENHFRGQVGQLVDQESNIYNIDYQFLLHSYLLNMFVEIRKWLEQRIESIELLIEDLHSYRMSCQASVVAVPDDDSVFSIELSDGIVTKKDTELREEAEFFYTSNAYGPFYQYFESFCNERSLDLFRQNAESFFDKQFHHIKEQSIVQFIGEKYLTSANHGALNVLLKQLINSSSVFINFMPDKLVDAEHAFFCPGDISENTRRKIIEELSARMTNLTCNESLSKDKITLFSMTSNFPAYYSQFLSEAAKRFMATEDMEDKRKAFTLDEVFENGFTYYPIDTDIAEKEVLETIVFACIFNLFEKEACQETHSLPAVSFHTLNVLCQYYSTHENKRRLLRLSEAVNEMHEQLGELTEEEQRRIIQSITQWADLLEVGYGPVINNLCNRLHNELLKFS